MLLSLKNVEFNVTTVDKAALPSEVKSLAPGASPPFIIQNNEVLTDIPIIEEVLESELTPPHFPSLTVHHPESTVAGNDIFNKFSAWIKDETDSNTTVKSRFLTSLKKLDVFLKMPLGYDDEIVDEEGDSLRKFLDGDEMSLADCNLLPKLHIIVVSIFF